MTGAKQATRPTWDIRVKVRTIYGHVPAEIADHEARGIVVRAGEVPVARIARDMPEAGCVGASWDVRAVESEVRESDAAGGLDVGSLAAGDGDILILMSIIEVESEWGGWGVLPSNIRLYNLSRLFDSGMDLVQLS